MGFRRALEQADAAVAAFAQARFRPRARRHAGEDLDVAEHLRRGGLHRFVGRMPRKFRNPLAHGGAIAVPPGAYAGFCDHAFATESLRQWLDVGTSPLWYEPRGFGCVSFVVAAARSGLYGPDGGG